MLSTCHTFHTNWQGQKILDVSSFDYMQSSALQIFFVLKMLSECAFQEDNATIRIYSQNLSITSFEHLCANGIDINC